LKKISIWLIRNPDHGWLLKTTPKKREWDHELN